MIINDGYVTESLCHNEECMQSIPSVRCEIMNNISKYCHSNYYCIVSTLSLVIVIIWSQSH